MIGEPSSEIFLQIDASDQCESRGARHLDIRQQINIALSVLSNREQDVLFAHEYCGESIAEIASWLHISQSRVRAILAEAKRKGLAAIEAAMQAQTQCRARRPKAALAAAA